MKKYVSNILRTICALIILLNIYVASVVLIKVDEEKYSKLSNITYVYDIAKYDDKPIIEQTSKQEDKNYPVLETFIGSMTGYGADCYGCSGVTRFGYDIRNGNIYYQDEVFGQVRIVAADKRFSYGTIIKVSGLNIYDEPFFAIVLDRGGIIKGNLMDLAFDSESNPLVSQIGYSKNIQYEVLRYGW